MTKELFNLLGSVGMFTVGLIIGLIGIYRENKNEWEDNGISIAMIVLGAFFTFIGFMLTCTVSWGDYANTFHSGIVK